MQLRKKKDSFQELRKGGNKSKRGGNPVILPENRRPAKNYMLYCRQFRSGNIQRVTTIAKGGGKNR